METPKFKNLHCYKAVNDNNGALRFVYHKNKKTLAKIVRACVTAFDDTERVETDGFRYAGEVVINVNKYRAIDTSKKPVLNLGETVAIHNNLRQALKGNVKFYVVFR